jgi:hypothetical protein
MSYDYSLFIAPGPGDMSSWGAVSPAPLGTPSELQDRVSKHFPQTSWEQFGTTIFGHAQLSPDGACDLQITPDDDGQCRWLTARRITRDEVLLLCRVLGLVAVDQQKVELIRP